MDFPGHSKTETEFTNEWSERVCEEAMAWAQEAGFVMICLQRDQGNHVELDGNPKEIQA